MEDETQENGMMGQFLDAMQQLHRLLRRQRFAEIEGVEPTRSQWLILRTLGRCESCSMGELAERLDVRASTMSQMIDRLELAGLVERRVDEADARSRSVSLTVSGCEALEAGRRAQENLLAASFAAFEAGEAEVLVRLLTRLAEVMKDAGSASNVPRR
ncbi:MAG: MarR family transcriptional regulator [Alicyclobacillaceae bacterium]|nr:MarR family transcriptional regulator [Alicyclobacillaceae bacterium]